MKKASRNISFRKSGGDSRLLKESLNRSIVEWYNCIAGTDPVESIAQLNDGSHFYKLVKLIKSPTNDEVESIAAKFVYVENCLNDFYHTESHLLVDFAACQNGNIFELAKVSILLLSAVVHLNIGSDSAFIVSLSQLDIAVQEDIKDCISAILLKTNSSSMSLSPDFATVLCVTTTSAPSSPVAVSPKRLRVLTSPRVLPSPRVPPPSPQVPPPSPRVPRVPASPRIQPSRVPASPRIPLPPPRISPSYETPQRGAPKKRRQNEAQFIAAPPHEDSPVKILLDSPLLKSQVALRNTEYKLKALQIYASEMEVVGAEHTAKITALAQENDEKERKIARLTTELRERHVATPQTPLQYSRIPMERTCENCILLRKNIEELQQHEEKLIEECELNRRKLDDEEASNKNLFQSNHLLNQKVTEFERDFTLLQEKKAQLEANLKDLNEIATVNKTKYEEIKQELKQERSSRSDQAMHACGENMKTAELTIALTEEVKRREDAVCKLQETVTQLQKERKEKQESLKDAARSKARANDFQKKTDMMAQKIESYMARDKEHTENKAVFHKRYQCLEKERNDEIKTNELLEQKIKALQKNVKDLRNESSNKGACDNLNATITSLKKELDEEKMKSSRSEEALKKYQCDSDVQRKLRDSQIEQMEKEHKEMQRQLDVEREQFRNFRAVKEEQLAGFSARFEELSNSIDLKEKEVEEITARFQDEIALKEKKSEKLTALQQERLNKIELLTTVCAQLERDKKELQEKIEEEQKRWLEEKENMEKECGSLKEMHTEEKSKNENALSRNKELELERENLLSKTGTQNKTIEQLKEEISQSRLTHETLLHENSNYVHECNKTYDSVKSLKQNVKQLESELERKKIKIEKYEAGMKDQEDQLSQLEREIKKLTKDKKDLSDKYKAATNKGSEYLEQKENYAEKLDSMKHQLAQSKTNLSHLTKSKAAEIRSLNDAFEVKMLRLQSEKHEVAEENKALLGEKVRLMKELSESNLEAKQLEKLQGELTQWKSQCDDLSRNLRQALADKDTILQQVQQLNHKSNDDQQSLKADVLKLQVEKEELIRQHCIIDSEKERSHNESLGKLSQENNQLSLDKFKLDRDVQSLKLVLSEKEDTITKMQENLKEQYKELSELRMQLDKITCSGLALESDRDKLKVQAAELTSTLESAKQDNTKLHTQLADVNKIKDVISLEKDILLERLEESERELRTLKESKCHAEKEYAMCVEDKDCKIEQLQKEIEALRAEVGKTTLKESLVNDYGKMLEDEKKLNEQLKNELLDKDSNLAKLLKEMEDLSAECELAKSELGELDEKYASIKKELRTSFADKEHVLTLVKSYKGKLETLMKKYQAKEKQLNRELTSSAQSVQQLRKELEETKTSIAPLKKEIEYLEKLNKQYQSEKSSLTVQCSSADRQIRDLRKLINGDNSSNFSRRQTLAGTSASSRASIQSAPVDRLSSTFKKGGVPITVSPKRHGSIFSMPRPQHDRRATLNGSSISDRIDNRSLLSGHFPIEDEEEYFDHRVIGRSQSDLTTGTPLTPSKRIGELQKRNSQYLPHLRTSYPVEMQAQPPCKVTDSAIKNGRRTAGSVLSISGKRPHGDTSSIKSEPVKKSTADVSMEEMPSTPAPKRSKWNPFPSPSAMEFFKSPIKHSTVFMNHMRSQGDRPSVGSLNNYFDFKKPNTHGNKK